MRRTYLVLLEWCIPMDTNSKGLRRHLWAKITSFICNLNIHSSSNFTIIRCSLRVPHLISSLIKVISSIQLLKEDLLPTQTFLRCPQEQDLWLVQDSIQVTMVNLEEWVSYSGNLQDSKGEWQVVPWSIKENYLHISIRFPKVMILWISDPTLTWWQKLAIWIAI